MENNEIVIVKTMYLAFYLIKEKEGKAIPVTGREGP
jgi:hypothetical protein